MKKLIISTLAVAAIFTGCNQATTTNNSVSKTVEVTGVRKSNVNAGSENLPVVKYTNQAPVPGQVKPFKKSFVTAPPMIPHSVEGMVPITIKSNMCLNCHMPASAKAMGVTPMPKDHFVDNFEGGKHIQRVAGSRFNCTLCHAPQAKVNPVIENKFESLRGK
ncbi:cytochrome c-type protein NapB [Lebetimonas natsushimae]|uniref:Periplasmic nitrate reductase, electron transfer subunit n=1 Tax=Lebetimonas natsushimae TaxID=1936991 RepID=A0A292YD61_9BACT|nr:nitrate reductase cytochrome c-type subunit [Lebetimonas natsushimae]GAX87917.1 cytochrome c-type protein NapB [Lebetimonas natsushimae]